MNYYNENDKKAAAWLRELIKAGHIPKGEVDERSISDVQPADLVRFTQCHFFAGIGGWSLALRLAGWPEDKPVWTGSCPCQPFSCAGKQLGESDERHLWPEFYRLIGARNPAIVLGEQVASAAGRLWLDGIRTDLEALAYEVGAADLCAAGISAPHIRQRLFWMAHAAGRGLRIDGSAPRCAGHIDQCSEVGRPAKSKGDEWDRLKRNGDTTGRGRFANGGWMGEPIQPGLEGQPGNGNAGNQSGRLDQESNGPVAETGANGAWGNFDIIPCRDGKQRRIESSTFPLVAGLPKGMVYSSDQSAPIDPKATAEGRIMRLRGYGNSIVPQLAAIFIESAIYAIQDTRG